MTSIPSELMDAAFLFNMFGRWYRGMNVLLVRDWSINAQFHSMGNSSWLPFPQNLWMQPFCSTCLADDTEEWMFYWTHPYFTVIIPFSQPQTEAWLPGQLNHAFGVYSLHHCVALTYAEKWMDSYLWRNCKHRTTWLSWPGNQASVCGWENGLA